MANNFVANFKLEKSEGQTVFFQLNDNAVNATFSLAEPNVMNATFEMLRSGGGDKYFAFEQGISSDTWTINHNLNKHPSITIVDEYERVIPGFAAEYIDDNTVIVRFNAAFKGKAYLN